MKTLLTVCFFLLINLQTWAQTKDEKALNEAVSVLKNNLLNPNKDILESLTIEELSYGHSSGLIEDKKAFVDALVSGRADFLTIEISDQTIRVVGKTAIVRHKLIADINNNGSASSVKLNVLYVWIKQSGQWKLLARQAAKF
jgi:hypothetical protein